MTIVAVNSIPMPGVPRPEPTHTYPKGKPIPLLLVQILFAVFFLGFGVGWASVHGSLGWKGIAFLVANLVVFGCVDDLLLRYYESKGRAVRVGRSVP